MTNFDKDLSKEKILAQYLDTIYATLKYNGERVSDMDLQFKGVDIIIYYKGKKYAIDEKAQLHYLNKDLPTFTFELSYLNKQKKLKKGWLFDEAKLTQFYFLVTGIYLNNGTTLSKPSDIKKVKIMSVNRRKLIEYLAKVNLTEEKLNQYDTYFRKSLLFGKNNIQELDEKKQGRLYFTAHLSEKPMNLQLKLAFLTKIGIGKVIYPPQQK